MQTHILFLMTGGRQVVLLPYLVPHLSFREAGSSRILRRQPGDLEDRQQPGQQAG